MTGDVEYEVSLRWNHNELLGLLPILEARIMAQYEAGPPKSDDDRARLASLVQQLATTVKLVTRMHLTASLFERATTKQERQGVHTIDRMLAEATQMEAFGWPDPL